MIVPISSSHEVVVVVPTGNCVKRRGFLDRTELRILAGTDGLYRLFGVRYFLVPGQLPGALTSGFVELKERAPSAMILVPLTHIFVVQTALQVACFLTRSFQVCLMVTSPDLLQHPLIRDWRGEIVGTLDQLRLLFEKEALNGDKPGTIKVA